MHAVLDVTSHLLESIKIILQTNNQVCSVSLCRLPRTAVLIAIRVVSFRFESFDHLISGSSSVCVGTRETSKSSTYECAGI